MNKLNESTVISDNGFKVRFGHHLLEYTDVKSNKTLSVELEDVGEPHLMIIYWDKSAHNWGDSKPLNDSEKELVKHRVINAAIFLKINFILK